MRRDKLSVTNGLSTDPGKHLTQEPAGAAGQKMSDTRKADEEAFKDRESRSSSLEEKVALLLVLIYAALVLALWVWTWVRR